MKNKPLYKDCAFALSEHTSLDTIYVVEFWCFVEDRIWGWETYMATEREEVARKAFEEVKRSHYYMRIRKTGEFLKNGSIIAHYEHNEEEQSQ